MQQTIRLSSRQYTALKNMVDQGGEISLEGARSIFQGTLNSFIQRGYVSYARGAIRLTREGIAAHLQMANENIMRKHPGNWGKRVLLVITTEVVGRMRRPRLSEGDYEL